MDALIRSWRALWGAVAVVAIGLVGIGLLGGFHAAFDSVVHFRAHAAVVCGLAALVLFVSTRRGGRRFAILLLVLAALGGASTVAYVLPSRSSDGSAGSLALLQMNMLISADPAEAYARIKSVRPDFVTMQETTREGVEADADLVGLYPYRASCEPLSQGGVVILSRYPIVSDAPLCRPEHGYVEVAVNVGGRTLTVISQHLNWPWPFGQQAGVAALADRLRELPDPAIIGGDFNAVAWSTTVRTYAALSGTRPVRGIGPTWLHRRIGAAWKAWVGLPIDHVLTSHLEVEGARRLAPTASDHLPVLVRFAISDN